VSGLLKNLRPGTRVCRFVAIFSTVCVVQSLPHMSSAKRLEGLVIWQVACELRDGIGAALSAGTGARDWDFKGQIGRSSRSVPANIAEGFGYFKPRPFGRYLRIARASAMETRNHILEGRTKGHFSAIQAAHFPSTSVANPRRHVQAHSLSGFV
jgi:four helix bundle protein